MSWSKRAPIPLLGLLIAGGIALAEQPTRSLWNAALSLDADQRQAVAQGDAIADWLHGLAFGFDIDQDSMSFASDLHASALELDLARVYRMLPDQGNGEHRSFVTGRSHGRQGYSLRIEGTPAAPSAGTFGDLDGGVGLRPARFDDRDAYAVRQGFDLATGAIDDREVARTAGALLREIEHAAATAPAGSKPGDAVLASLHTALPNAWGYLDRFVDIDRVGGMTASGLFAVEGVLRIDLAALTAEFPHLGRYLDRMDDLFEGTVTIGDTTGRKLVVFEARSETALLAVRFVTTDGALVPFSSQGSHADDQIPLGEATELDLVVTIDGAVRHQGTKVSVDAWPIPMHYEVRPGGAAATGYIQRPASFDMRGESAFTAFLVSAAESTFQLDQHADAMFRGIAAGHDGRGSRVQVGVVQRDGHHVVHEEIDTLLVDNALIRFGARVIGGVLVPDHKASGDFVRLEHEFLGHLASDWSQARTDLLAQSSKAAE